MVNIIENLMEFKEGIYISEPLGRLISEGEKTLIVKKKKFPWENKLKYLISGELCYGIIRIKKIYPLPIDEFRKQEEKHKISEFERSRWYPNVQILFAYEFDIIEKYKNPKKVELPKDVKTDIKEVKFLSKITYEEESKIINENKKKPEAFKPHKFKPAEWTHKNGHPRCLICGDEELTDEACDEYGIPKGWCKGIEKENLSEEYSPVGPSDDHDKGRAVKWEEVTQYWKKPIKLVEGFIQLIGGVPSHKEGSTGDIDVLIRKSEPKDSEDMPIKFRLFRSLPRELGNRVHFVYDKFYGPMTDNVKVYDLVLMPVNELKVHKMAEKPWARIWEVSKDLDKVSKKELIKRHDWLHSCYKEGSGPKEDMIDIHVMIWKEMEKRGIEHDKISPGDDLDKKSRFPIEEYPPIPKGMEEIQKMTENLSEISDKELWEKYEKLKLMVK